MNRAQAVQWLSGYPPMQRAIEWYKHWRTPIYILSYPKCGRTWLRLMIGKALDEQFHLGLANPMEIGRLHQLNGAIPRMRLSHESAYREHVATDSTRRYRNKTVLLLARDPRDVLVSMYFEASRRRDKHGAPRTAYSGDITAFIREPVMGLDSIIDYYNRWAECRDVPRRFELLTYEEMHADTAAALRRTFAIMDVAVSDAAIAQAVAFSKFENMRKLEQNNTFGSARLRAGDAADGESFKVRKGKVGGYREYLGAADLDYVNARIRERLADYFSAYRAA
jgi:sulfotransferase family protein